MLESTDSQAINEQQTELRYRVGYWWGEKKSQKLNATELEALFLERNCELVKLDLERPLEEQGPFSLIVHKVSDILVKADQGDTVAKKTISAFDSYVRKHPQTIVLDPLENNRILLDRYKQYRLIEQSGLAREGVIFTPPFVHLTSTNLDVNRGRIRRSKITFPLVCKPILAQGSTGAHQMCIIFNEAGLKDVKPPCVAQSFVNHNAKLFKLFVIKDKYYVIERPSLKNFQAGDFETVFFYSHDISKPNSSSSLNELDEEDKLNLEKIMSQLSVNNIKQSANLTRDTNNGGTLQTIYDEDEGVDDNSYPQDTTPPNGDHIREPITGNNHSLINHYSPLMPNSKRLDQIVKTFSEKLGLTFYGLDIIIEKETSRYAIIDMNTFPGYDGVDGFLALFRDVVCDAIPKVTDQSSHAQLMKVKRKPTEFDSGIEST